MTLNNRLAAMLRSLAASYRKRYQIIVNDPVERPSQDHLLKRADALDAKADAWEKQPTTK